MFPTLDVLTRQLRVVLPAPRDGWRLITDPRVGAIVGLDTANGYRGLAIATNGIMVLIYNESSGLVRFGHLEWFQPDVSDMDDVVVGSSKRKVKPAKGFEDYLGF
jgi:hypothetical protein